jgi:hypothetical protein
MADCYKLTAVDDFTKYVETLSDETGYEDSRLQACKPVICQAIYGIGNPDISGIGVTKQSHHHHQDEMSLTSRYRSPLAIS